ncbi:hypothetical protein Tco_0046976 [Tanacetum coccineum]
MSNSNTNLQTQSSNALHNAIMEAGSKDRPPMLAPGNYVQWKSRIKRYIDTKPNSELIHYSLQNPPYIYQWAEKTVPVAEGSSETTTERYMENYKNVSQDIRDQMNAEAEAVQIILTGIDNDIYSTVDACPNACEMWKAIERLKQGESINVQDLETNLYWEFGKFTSRDGESLESYYSRFYKMMNELVRNQCNVTNHQVNVQFLLQLQPEWQRFVTLVKQSQELKTVSYHKLYDILKQHQNEVNEIRTERLARTANPLALVGPFKVIKRVGDVAYKLELPEEVIRVRNTFYVSNLKKCHADEPLAIPLDGLHFDDKLQFVEEPIEITDREVKRLKRSRIPLVKVRWNSKRGPEFTWEREDQFRKKYPHLFSKTGPSSNDTKTPSPKHQLSSPSAPNASSKTPSTKGTSSSSIDYTPKSPTSSTSPSTNGTSPPPRVPPPPPTQENASMDITLTLSPLTPIDVQFDTQSPSPPIFGHPIP